MLFSGKFADLSPSCKQETIALDVLNDSDPPRKITALPDFKHNADGGYNFVYLNGTGPGGSLDTSLSQTGYGFDDASGLGSLDGTELLGYLKEVHGLI